MVFISYSSKDKARAEPIYFGLKEKGVPCWMAPHDIPRNTRSWPAEITRAIKKCDVFLLLFTKEANISPEVEGEVTLARNRNKDIISLRLDDEEESDGLEYLLSGRQHIPAVNLSVEIVINLLLPELPRQKVETAEVCREESRVHRHLVRNQSQLVRMPVSSR